MILTNFYNTTPQVTSKILIQIFTILCLADIIWIIYFSSAWIEISEEEKARIGNDDSGIIPFWDSLWFIHGLVYFLSYIELILKLLLLYYLFVDYKGKYPLSSLINLNYEENYGNKSNDITPDEEQQQNNSNISNDMEFPKDIGTNSFDNNLNM